MLDTPEVIKELYLTDGIRKNFRVTFPDDDIPDITSDNIVQGSIRFTESACSQEQFKFGLCEASQIEFECYGVSNIKKKKIQCFIEIDLSSLSDEDRAQYGQTSPDLNYIFHRLSLGVFRVTSCPKIERDVYENNEFEGTVLTKRTITAYGPSYDFTWDMDKFELEKWTDSIFVSSEKIDIFKWLFCNYMQKGWRTFFNENDMTNFNDHMQVLQRSADSRHIPTGYHTVTITLNIQTYHFAGLDGTDSNFEKNRLALYYLKHNTYSHEKIREEIETLLDEWERQYNIKISYESRTNAYWVDRKGFLDYIIGFIEKGVWSYTFDFTSDTDDLYIPSGTEFVCCQGLAYSASVRFLNALRCVRSINLSLMDETSERLEYKTVWTVINGSSEVDDMLYQVDTSKYDSGIMLDPELFLDLDPAEVIQAYLELDARFGRYNRAGYLEFYRFSDLVDEEIKKDTYIEAEYEDSYTKPYDRVSVTYENENDETISTYYQFVKQLPENLDAHPDYLDKDCIYVNEYNPDDYQTYSLGYNYLIQNSRFTADRIKEILRIVANNLKNVYYLPMNLDLVGRPWLEAGDVITTFKYGKREVYEPITIEERRGNDWSRFRYQENVFGFYVDHRYDNYEDFLTIDYENNIIEFHIIDFIKTIKKDYPNTFGNIDNIDTTFIKSFTFHNNVQDVDEYTVELIAEDLNLGAFVQSRTPLGFQTTSNINIYVDDQNIGQLIGDEGYANGKITIIDGTHPEEQPVNRKYSFTFPFKYGSKMNISLTNIIVYNIDLANLNVDDLSGRIYLKLPLMIPKEDDGLEYIPEYIQEGLVLYSKTGELLSGLTLTNLTDIEDYRTLETWAFSYERKSESLDPSALLATYCKPLLNDLEDFEFTITYKFGKNDKSGMEGTYLMFDITEIPPTEEDGEKTWDPNAHIRNYILNETVEDASTLIAVGGEKKYKVNLKQDCVYLMRIYFSGTDILKDDGTMYGDFSLSFLKNGIKVNEVINDEGSFQSIILRRDMDIGYFLRDNFEARGDE